MPILAIAYPSASDTRPAARKEIQTAAPAMSPACPRRAKMPAPTMAPMPRKTAPRSVICWVGARPDSDDAGWVGVVPMGASLDAVVIRCQRYSGTGSGSVILPRWDA